ncbi:MAG: hypothetical protein C4K60_10045 [Ideonella sp. MAG2]|nr:MAG: hypothetical protein C4K60_10045 [Ideonella sp. MAG2]
MANALKRSSMTPQEYLAWEAQQPVRHDFVGGEVYAMAGAEDRHVTVTLNLAMALRQHLAGSPCKTYVTDMKLQSQDASAYFYPDVMVTCSAADRQQPLIKAEPSLVVEVLSASTAAYDRGEKFAHYRAIPSLQEVAFVDIDARRTDVYRKGVDGLWVLHPFGPAETVLFKSVDLSLSAEKLFEDVEERATESPAG